MQIYNELYQFIEDNKFQSFCDQPTSNVNIANQALDDLVNSENVDPKF